MPPAFVCRALRVSPTRWHLAHTTWFFETFILAERPGYEPFNPSFNYIFNSYYNSIGDPYPRHERGLLSRPSLDEVLTYRRYVDHAMSEVFESEPALCRAGDRIEVGLQHEQQHQELILTDIKHVLGRFLVLRGAETRSARSRRYRRFLRFPRQAGNGPTAAMGNVRSLS